MNALHKSIDETLAAIRDNHEREIRSAQDAQVAANLETALCREALRKAQTERDYYMRIATKLITQFGVVEAVFAEAKALALTISHEPQPETDASVNAVQAALTAQRPRICPQDDHCVWPRCDCKELSEEKPNGGL